MLRKILFSSCLAAAMVSGAEFPAFDVASIKPNTTAGPGGMRFDPAGVTIRWASLLDLIDTAYQIPYSRVATADPRTRDLLQARYDVTATAGREVPKDQLLVMLQTLLADRFKLALHHQATVQPVYKLVVARTGPKLGTRDPSCIFPKCMTFNNTEMWIFAATLSGHMGRPVLDLTGLQGAYDFTLRLDTLEALSPDDPDLKTKFTDWSQSSIFSDIEKQLGLKLESDKAPVDTLVIDHAEPPSAN